MNIERYVPEFLHVMLLTPDFTTLPPHPGEKRRNTQKKIIKKNKSKQRKQDADERKANKRRPTEGEKGRRRNIAEPTQNPLHYESKPLLKPPVGHEFEMGN